MVAIVNIFLIPKSIDDRLKDDERVTCQAGTNPNVDDDTITSIPIIQSVVDAYCGGVGVYKMERGDGCPPDKYCCKLKTCFDYVLNKVCSMKIFLEQQQQQQQPSINLQ